jgi:hypothetical protein
MEKRNNFLVLIVIFIVLSLFAACGDSTGSNTGSNTDSDVPGSTPVPGSTLADKLAWLRTNAERDSSYLLDITTAYEELAPQNLSYPGRDNITIRLKGIGIGRVIGYSSFTNSSDSKPLFTVGDGVTLILEENIILCKDDLYRNYSPAVKVNSSGTLIMIQGAKITNFNDKSNISVVHVNGGTFNMSGGEIFGNSTCGVSIDSGGTFTMSGGEIFGNSIGGVSIGSGGNFTMSGGEIYGNTSYNGGGVSVDGGTFIKSGGIITGYTSDTVKGNVAKNIYVGDGIQDNEGHAVYVSSSRYRNTTAGETDQIDTTTGKGLSANGNSPFEQ